MVLVYGKISVRDGLSSRAIFCMILVMGLEFWQDWWCGETSLAVRYPNLFKFCRNKDASVAELMLSTNGVLFWDVRFVRVCMLGILRLCLTSW